MFNILYTGNGNFSIKGGVEVLCSKEVIITTPDPLSNDKTTHELTLDSISYTLNEFTTDDASCPILTYEAHGLKSGTTQPECPEPDALIGCRFMLINGAFLQ
jgi:hypothetical protein